MKMYQYKIQWLLRPKEAFKLIKLLGVRSFDVIYLRDFEMKEIDIYDRFIQFPSGIAELETIKYIKRQIKHPSKGIFYVEVIRK